MKIDSQYIRELASILYCPDSTVVPVVTSAGSGISFKDLLMPMAT